MSGSKTKILSKCHIYVGDTPTCICIYIILCFLCHRSSRVMKPKLMNYKKFRDKNSRDAFIQNNLQILNIIKVCSYFDKKIIMSDWQWQLRDLIQRLCRHRNVIYNCKENTSRDLVLSVSQSPFMVLRFLILLYDWLIVSPYLRLLISWIQMASNWNEFKDV